MKSTTSTLENVPNMMLQAEEEPTEFNPTSRSWLLENQENAFKYSPNDTCCIVDCKSAKSIRNFSSLLGNWKVKDDHPHQKICVYHYNHDLKLHPRTGSRKKRKRFVNNVIPQNESCKRDEREYPRKRRKVHDKKSDLPEKVAAPIEESVNGCCCISMCMNSVYATSKRYNEMVGEWKPKVEVHKSKLPRLRVCGEHYMRDLTYYPRERLRMFRRPVSDETQESERTVNERQLESRNYCSEFEQKIGFLLFASMFV